MDLPRHKLVIFTDGEDLCPVATGCQLDGQEILIPGGRAVTVEASDTDALLALIPVYVSRVEYRTRKRETASTPKNEPRGWGRLFPVRAFRRG